MFVKIPLVLALALGVSATLDPADSNTKGKYPSNPGCSPVKISKAIQAAECAYNTRSSAQTFAVFTTDHQYDSVYGGPYGTCVAYNACAVTAEDIDTVDSDRWTFFWGSDEGESSGVGTDCIKDPSTGECGCENSDGTFIPGGTNCV